MKYNLKKGGMHLAMALTLFFLLIILSLNIISITGYTILKNKGLILSDNNQTINISDITPPNITIIGNNPEILLVGDQYNDSGASAIDNVDGNLTENISTTSNVNTSREGNYSVIYFVSDSSGNNASVIRNVSVLAAIINDTIDLIGPAISIDSPISQLYITNNISISININEIGRCKYTLNSSNNKSLFTDNNIYFYNDEYNLVNADYKLTANCYDSNNNFNSTHVSFTIRYSPEVVTINDNNDVSSSSGGDVSPIVIPPIVYKQNNITNASSATKINEAISPRNTNNDNKESSEDNKIDQLNSESDINTTKVSSNILGNAIYDQQSGKFNIKTIIIIALTGMLLAGLLTFMNITGKENKEDFEGKRKLREWVHQARNLGYTEQLMEKLLVEVGVNREMVMEAIRGTRSNIAY